MVNEHDQSIKPGDCRMNTDSFFKIKLFVQRTKHIRTKLFLRYLNFINSIRKSKKKCLSSLAEMAICDQTSTTKKNLNVISAESGFENVLDMDPRSVVSNIEYEKIPDEEQWKVEFLREIMSVRNGELEFQDNQFEMKEIQTLVNYISSM